MTKDKTNPAIEIYLRSNQIEDTIQMIEQDGWNAAEIFYDDLKDFCREVGGGSPTRGEYAYMRDFITYLINRNDYWKVED